jgi:hypothetical protein
MPNLPEHEVEHLKLWDVLKAKGTDEQRTFVKNLVGFAAPNRIRRL